LKQCVDIVFKLVLAFCYKKEDSIGKWCLF
jgi:hypothetical protein